MPTGTLTSFDLPTGLMLDYDDTIYELDPFDTPITGGVGAEGGPIVGSEQGFETNFKWMDETILAPRTTITTTLAMGGTTLTFSSAGEALRFQAGDVLRLEAELVRITVMASTTTATITRGFASTSDVAHTQPFTAIGVGTALPEGSDAGIARAVDRVERQNYMQIFGPVTVQMSGTEMVVRKYGLTTTEWDHQVAMRIREIAVLFEQSLLYGLSSNDTTNKIRTMGGFLEFITSVVDSTASAITLTRVNTMMQTLFDNGASLGRMRLIVGSKPAVDISAFAGGTIFIQQGDSARGTVVQYIDTDFGRVTKVIDRWCRTQDAFLINPENVTIKTLRPLFFKRLGSTGDSEKGILVMEKSVKIKGNKHLGRFSALV
jgi:hypothetical protein